MLTLEQTMASVAERLDDLRKRIIANMDAAGQRATGRTAASLQVERVSENEVRLVARPFFSALETGSAPWSGKTGNPMSAEEFREVIRNWAVAKGLFAAADKELPRFAYLAARKIMREGSRLYRIGGRTDIFTSEVAAAEREIKEAVAKDLSVSVSQIITQIINYKSTGIWT